MNAVTRVASSRTDMVLSDFAADVCAFLVIHGCIDFSDASAAVARAGIRAGWVDQRSRRFDDLLERLERRIGMTILAIEAEATSKIRKAVEFCLEKGYDPDVTYEIVDALNRLHDNVLPPRCLDFLIKEGGALGQSRTT